MGYGVTSQVLSRYSNDQIALALAQQGKNGQGFAEGALYIRETGGEDQVWVWTSTNGHRRIGLDLKTYKSTYKPDSAIAIGDWADDSQQTVTIDLNLDYETGDRIEISYDQSNYWLAEVDSYDGDDGTIVFTITEGIAEGTDSFSIFTFDQYNPSVRNDNVLAVRVIVSSYDNLVSQTVFTVYDGAFGLVTAPQGTKYLPGSLGGDFYPAGLYVYSSSADAWTFLTASLTEGVYTAVQNQLAIQLLSSSTIEVADGSAVYNDTSSELHFNVSGDAITGVTSGTDFVSSSWRTVNTGGGGEQFADQQELEDFISNKRDFRTDIGAQATLTTGDVTLDLLEQDGATGGQLLGWNSTDLTWEPTNAASGGNGFTTYTSFADLPGTDASPPAVNGDLALVLVENATYPAYMWFDATVGDNGTWISTGMVVDEGNGLGLNATTRRLEMFEATATQRGTVGIGDQTFGGNKTFQLDSTNPTFTIEKSDGTDLFRVSGDNIEVNNSADIIIHQGTLTEDSVLQKLVFVEGSGFDSTETGYLNATRMRLYSRWSNGSLADGFDLPEIHTSTVAVAFDTDDADAWQTDNPAFAIYGTADHNNDDRTVYDIEVHTKGNGTNVDSRYVFKTMNDNSQVDALFIEHDRIRPTLATIFEDKVRFNEKTTTELTAIASPLEGDVYYNTTDSIPQYYDGTNFVDFVPEANIPGWSQNDGTPINPAQINIDTTGPLTYAVSDGVITIGSTGGGGDSTLPDAPDAVAAATVYQLQVPATGSVDAISWVIPSATGGSAFTTNISATLTDPTLTLSSDEGYTAGNETGRINFDGRNTADDAAITYASIFADNNSLITIGDSTNTTLVPGLSQFMGNTEHVDDPTSNPAAGYNASSIGFASLESTDSDEADYYTGASIHEYIVDRNTNNTELHFFAGDGNSADELLLNVGNTRAHFGDLDSEIQDRTGDLDANIRTAYPLNTWSFQTNDFYRYKPSTELGAIEDTFLNDRTPGDKLPLYIGLTQGRWNLKDDSSDATNVTNLIEVRHEYNEDTDNRWGSHIISTWTGDRDSATVTQYDTAKFEPAHVTFYSGANGNTEGDIMVNHEVGNMFTVSFMDMIITGSTDIPDDSGNTSNDGTDTTARPYEAYYCKDGNTYFRVERVAADETVTDATNPWWIGLINSENRFHTEQMWSTSNNDTRVLIDIRY